MKRNYIKIQPYINGVPAKDDGEIVVTLPIYSIYDENKNEIMDHVFYIISEEELFEYENTKSFTELIHKMTLEFCENCFDFEDNLTEILVNFYDTVTDELLFGISIKCIDNDEFISDYIILDYEDDCDGDCESCSKYEDEYSNRYITNYCFGFGFGFDF